MKLKDLTGEKFGLLTVLNREANRNTWTMWKCKCDCGNEHITYSTHLLRGNVTNCGCRNNKKGADHVQWTGYGEISGRKWNSIRRMNQKGKRKSRVNLTFEIDIEYAWNLFLKQDRKCALSGIPLKFGQSNTDETTASLDRIDNQKGYIEGNVQWVHKDVNRMKNIFTQDRFLEICRLVTGGYEKK